MTIQLIRLQQSLCSGRRCRTDSLYAGVRERHRRICGNGGSLRRFAELWKGMVECDMNEKITAILEETGKVIKGKEETLEKILMAVLAEGNVLLEDVPGVGKTTLALAFSKSLGLSYRRIQFTPDIMPSDITGFTMYDRRSGAFRFQEGPVLQCSLLLADEINRTASKTQAALLEVMEEKQVTVDGESHSVQRPFFVIATQNPAGTAGDTDAAASTA